MKILIVGTGNVASHLVKRCLEIGISISVRGRTDDKANLFADEYGISVLEASASPENFELIILCLTDSALKEQLPFYSQFGPTATVSGGFSINGIKHTFPIGVFYPLQTFNKDSEIDWKQIPFFIESSDSAFESALLKLGTQLGKESLKLDEAGRIKLHITAVFVNNFVNHLTILASNFSKENNLDFTWFKALISETHRKIIDGSFELQQTGPAKRGDLITIEQHMNVLPEELKKVYQTLSEDILSHYNSQKK